MIRVIYRWRVPAENFNAFKEVWNTTTNHIHESVPGALGSFMLKSKENEREIITIAKWESLAAWKEFWGDADPSQMLAMHKFGKRLSAAAYEEIEDHTK